MSRTVISAFLAAALLATAFSTGAAQSSLPPAASFGGPVTQLPANVTPPAGTTVKINWRGVGTQNYSSGSNSQYQSAGAMANLFLQNATAASSPVGMHFFVSSGSGTSPAFTRFDVTTGQELGRVVCSLVAQSPTANTNDDGGYGSVPNLLLQATSATGFFQGVTYVTRTNNTGGVVPGNPKLFTLPTSPQGIPDALLAVPYQADYKFWVGGSASPPGTSTGSAAPPVSVSRAPPPASG